MTALNKQALREAAERAMHDDWGYDTDIFHEQVTPSVVLALLDELESKQTFQHAFFRQSLMYDVVAEAYEEAKEQIAKDVEIKARLCRESNSLHDRLRAAERSIAELESKNSNLRTIAHERNELAIRANLDSINDAVEMDGLHKRIAEFERSETQLISERDDAESALNDAYKAVMGQPPEWSNWFSFENAIDEIELACELWRNQTDDVIQFRQRIAELEAREVMLPDRKSEIFWPGDAAEFDILGYVIAVKSAIRATGIKVKES